MSYPITFIYNNKGDYAGKYSNNMCIAAPSEQPAAKPQAAKPQPQVAAKVDPQAEMTWYKALSHFIFGAGAVGGAVGCNSATDGDLIDDAFTDGGVGPVPPEVPEGSEEVPDCPGCYETDGGIIPPQDDDGNPILFDGAFDIEVVGGEVVSNFSQAAPILLEFPYLFGGNLQNKKLRIEIAWVPGNVPEMPADACHKGLLPVAQLSPEAQALSDADKELYGITFCPEEGYQHLVGCPHEEYGNQITTLLGGFTLLNGEWNGEEAVPNGQELDVTYITPPEFDAAPLSSETLAFEIPADCGSDPQVFEMPLTVDAEADAADLPWWSDGNLWLKFEPLTLIGRSDNFVPGITYKNHLKVRLTLVEE
ncbi:hypothetical protein ACFL1W_00490 [Candidatus Margulisiibacteriota bacterium]